MLIAVISIPFISWNWIGKSQQIGWDKGMFGMVKTQKYNEWAMQNRHFHRHSVPDLLKGGGEEKHGAPGEAQWWVNVRGKIGTFPFWPISFGTPIVHGMGECNRGQPILVCCNCFGPFMKLMRTLASISGGWGWRVPPKLGRHCCAEGQQFRPVQAGTKTSKFDAFYSGAKTSNSSEFLTAKITSIWCLFKPIIFLDTVGQRLVCAALL